MLGSRCTAGSRHVGDRWMFCMMRRNGCWRQRHAVKHCTPGHEAREMGPGLASNVIGSGVKSTRELRACDENHVMHV